MKKRIIGILNGMAVLFLLHMLPTHATANQSRTIDQSLPAEQALPAAPLISASSPRGDLTLALPQGWSLTASPQGDAVAAKPAGKTQPSIYLVVVGVSDLRYQARLAACASGGFNPFGNPLSQCVIPSVQTQLSDSSRKWTPDEGFRLILQRQSSMGRQTFGAPALIPLSSSQSFFRVTGMTSSGPIEQWGIITMFYLPNPMLSQGAVTTLAFLAGCTAPPDQADSFRRTCAGVLNSFRPTPTWQGRIAAGIVNIYVQEAQTLLQMGRNIAQGFAVRQQMIAAFSQSVQHTQLHTFQAIQARNYRTGQNWIATFEGNTIMRDPATGKIYTVPYGYRSYGIDDRGPVPTILMGPDESPGKSIGSAQSQRVLEPSN